MTPRKTKSNTRKTKRKRSRSRKIVKFLVLSCIFAGCLLGLFIGSVYFGTWGKIPDYRMLREIRHHEASSVYSEDGELLGKYFIENRTNVLFDSISPNAIHALIATEDARFYEHQGFDKISMLRVLVKTLLLGDRRAGGGSTLSQQLAKNLFPREEGGKWYMPVIKIKEIITAHRLEKLYTKTEILTLYLNTVSFGEDVFGIESAAQKYFSTTATHLSKPEAALLIGMLKAPSYYNPRLHPERARQRRNTVINQMVKYDYLTLEEGHRLKQLPVGLAYKPLNHYSGLAPYLREQVRQECVRVLREYNARHHTNYDLYKDGLIITTTLDAELQQYAETAVKQHVRELQHAFYTHWGKQDPWGNNTLLLDKAIRQSATYRALQKQGLPDKAIRTEMQKKRPMTLYSAYQGEIQTEMSPIDSIKHDLKILHPGLIAVEPGSGKIKAWVGGLDFKYFQYDQVLASRQVGSVFKPVVYSAAIEQGARLDAYYKNEQKSYAEYDNWTPRNADNRYNGYYTLRGALSHSINTIAVEVLLQTGIAQTIRHAHRLGIESDLEAVPSIALGAANIPLIEMIRPYLCYANNGMSNRPYYLQSIKDRTGRILYEAPNPTPQRVISTREAHAMTSMLQTAIQEGTGKRLVTRHGLERVAIAGKTGTTQNQADGWFIGYIPELVVGIRVGANNAQIHFNSIALGQGANMALPIFGLFMQQCLNSTTYSHWEDAQFPLPVMEQNATSVLPSFKEEMNLLDKLSNRKVEKRKQTLADTLPKTKKNFFQRIGNLFRKKNKE